MSSMEVNVNLYKEDGETLCASQNEFGMDVSDENVFDECQDKRMQEITIQRFNCTQPFYPSFGYNISTCQPGTTVVVVCNCNIS